MKLIILNIFFLFIVFNNISLADNRTIRIIKLIDEELIEVKKLDRYAKSRNPDHQLRIAELVLEKAKLLRNVENSQYLKLSVEERRKVEKEKYFKNSNELLVLANRICLRLIKYAPNYSKIGDAYYIVGYNLKDSAREKEAISYFQKAIQYTKSSSNTKYRAMIALAEIEYNQRNYQKSIPLYETALSKIDDALWTKDAFNLAWCYYRSNQHGKSISLMLKVLERSNNDQYVDMKNEVFRDIGQVYATSGKIEEGIRFYQKFGQDFTLKLVDIANVLRTDGRIAESNKVLQYAEKYTKNSVEEIEVYLQMLINAEKYSKFAEHLTYVRKLNIHFLKNSLSPEQVSQYSFQVEKVAAILQSRVIAKTYENTKTRNQFAQWALEYYDYLSKIKPKDKSQIAYLQGEIEFAVGEYKKANLKYLLSFDESLLIKDNKGMKQSINAALTALGKIPLNEKKENSYFINTYSKYLLFDSSSERAKEIYQKIFQIYLEENQPDEAEKVLFEFKKNFPRELVTTEAMIALLMDYYKKKNNVNKIRYWASLIENKKFIVSPSYFNKIQQLLTNLQIKDVQQLLSSGDKAQALKGYYNVLADPYSTQKSKTNAKYNIAALYYDMGDSEESYKWSMESLNEMSSKESLQFASSFLAISKFLFLNLKTQESAHLSAKLFANICNENSQLKGISFKNSFFLYLADNKIKEGNDLLKLSSKCGVEEKLRAQASFEVIDKFYDLKYFDLYEMSVLNLAKSENYKYRVLSHLDKLMQVYGELNNTEKVKSILLLKINIIEEINKKKIQLSIEDQTVVDLYEISNISTSYNNFLNEKLVFPDSLFNEILERRLSGLSRFTEEIEKILQRGSPEAISRGGRLILEAYAKLINDISTFTPPDKSDDYKKSFKDAMTEVVNPLTRKLNDLKASYVKVITNNSILSNDNKVIFGVTSEFSPFGIPLKAAQFSGGF